MLLILADNRQIHNGVASRQGDLQRRLCSEVFSAEMVPSVCASLYECVCAVEQRMCARGFFRVFFFRAKIIQFGDKNDKIILLLNESGRSNSELSILS